MKHFLILLILLSRPAFSQTVSTVEELVAAVRDGKEGTQINVGPGVYKLSAPLRTKTGMTIKEPELGKLSLPIRPIGNLLPKSCLTPKST